MGYIFGGKTGLSQQDLRRERERYQPQPLPQNMSEGMVAVADALVRRWGADQQQFPDAPAGSFGSLLNGANGPLGKLFRPRGGGLY